MNDFMEVRHGLACLSSVFASAAGTRYKAALDLVVPGISAEVENLFTGWVPHIYTDTYSACFPEHDNSENILGRLSMWRAYGADNGVAFVMNEFFSRLPAR